LFSRLQEELNRMVNEFMEQGKGELREDAWTPNIDVLETPTAVEIIAEVPGMRAADLELEVAGNIVTLAGRKKTSYPPGQVRFERVERAQGGFRRQLSLDQPVNGSQAQAVLQNGLLRVTFPKIEDKRRQVRQLEIQTAD
jgi:HSP20 family protein